LTYEELMKDAKESIVFADMSARNGHKQMSMANSLSAISRLLMAKELREKAKDVGHW
jgi:mannitol/fructose-specific phosphotransferase system IIA component (Ntr-type)